MAKKSVVSKLLVATIGAIGLACLLGLAIGLSLFTVERPLPPFTEPSLSRLGKYKTAVVSSDGVPCSEIGRDIMKDGGNAMDAAIATLFCIGVVNPQSAGIGGGFLMTIYDSKTGVARCLDARETAPAAATEDMYDGNATLSQIGGLSVAVPGELAGYWAAHQEYGKLPWSRLVLPAAYLAEKGLNINWHLASALARKESLIKSEPTLWEFINKSNGQVKVEGDKYSLPALAKTLKTIAQEGVEAFYEGEIGEKFVQDVKERGGIITKEDLLNYRVKWVDPIKSELKDGLTLYSIPPPGSGALTAYILNILKNLVPWKKEAARDPLTYHQIAEAFKYAYAYRTKLGDPYNNTRVQQLTESLKSESLANETRNKINNLKTANDPQYYGAVSYNPDDQGTTHVSTLDKDGFAVAVTSTVNLLLGAGFISEQTGIIPNDEMDDFSSPSNANYFGMPPSEANFIRKNKRPLSSMTPTIIVNSTTNQVRLVIGGAGGTRITTSVAYVIIRNLWFGETIKEAIDSKRIHHQLFPMTFQHEYGFPSEILDEITRKGHNTSSYGLNLGINSVVCAIAVEPNGSILYANSDYRKRGDVAGIDPLN